MTGGGGRRRDRLGGGGTGGGPAALRGRLGVQNLLTPVSTMVPHAVCRQKERPDCLRAVRKLGGLDDRYVCTAWRVRLNGDLDGLGEAARCRKTASTLGKMGKIDKSRQQMVCMQTVRFD